MRQCPILLVKVKKKKENNNYELDGEQTRVGVLHV